MKKFNAVRQEEMYLDIACIFIHGKHYLAYRLDGEKIGWNDSLVKSIKYLDPFHFHFVNRSVIVNRKAISEVRVVTKRNTKVTLTIKNMEALDVSQRENAGFKKWLAAEPEKGAQV